MRTWMPKTAAGYRCVLSGAAREGAGVEALQEAAFFVMDGPAPTPERRNFRQHVYEGDQGE